MNCLYCNEIIKTSTHLCKALVVNSYSYKVITYVDINHFYFYYDHPNNYPPSYLIIKAHYFLKTNKIIINQPFYHSYQFSFKDILCMLEFYSLKIKNKADKINPIALISLLDKLPHLNIAQNKKLLQNELDKYIKLQAFI